MKPVIILFNGFGASNLYWQYDADKTPKTAKLRKNDFLTNLEKIGDVYTFNSTFFNVDYYYVPEKEKQRNIWKKIYEKYEPHTSNIDFTLEDLSFKNICENVYKNVVEKYGKNRKYIAIGHSYGGSIALLFSKLYKNECQLVALIDNPPHTLDFFKKYENTAKDKKIIVTILDYNYF